MSGAQGLGRGRAKAPRGYKAPLLPKHMIQIAPNTRQPFCSLSVRQTGKETIDSGCSCRMCWWSCPLPMASCVERDSPCISKARPGSKLLLGCLSCPRCCGPCVLPVNTRQVSAGTPFWHVPQWALLFLSLLLSYFHWLYWEQQYPGFIPLHMTSLASSWTGSRLPIFRQKGGTWQRAWVAVARQHGGTEWAGSGPGGVTVSPWVSAMPAARALPQQGWAVLWWAVWQLQAGTWLTGGSPVGLRRILQFGASMDLIHRFALSRHTWVELQHLRGNDKF